MTGLRRRARPADWLPRLAPIALQRRPADDVGRSGRVVAILNPASRRFAHVGTLIMRQARARGCELEILTTTVADPGGGQAKAALALDPALIIVAGGDGTVRKVAGGLVGSDVPLAVVPAGSGNLFARNLGHRPWRVGDAVRNAFDGGLTRIDVGWAEATFAGGAGAPEPFLVMAGLGRDAQTVARTPAAAKRRFGWLAYAFSAVREALRPPFEVAVEIDGAPAQRVGVWSLLVGNTPDIVAGIAVFGRALADDGRLDTMAVRVRTVFGWIPVAAKGLLRFRADVDALRYGTARSVVIEPDRAMPAQVDGDILAGVRRLAIRVEPAALLIKVPAQDRLFHRRIRG